MAQLMVHMNKQIALPSGKPFDIRERLFLFACDIVVMSQKLHTRGQIAGALSAQLMDAAVSAAANAEEADDASSDKDFRAKERICLREIKEARLRLRVLRRTGLVDSSVDALIREAEELRRIVSTIIRNNARRSVQPPPSDGSTAKN
jgi:four helix bundle protein